MSVLVTIPARYASTRFPGKPLVDIGGKSMIQRVYEQCTQVAAVSKVIVATDDERILQAVQDFGGCAEMTREDHTSGTDRCAEVAARHPGHEIVVNVQGDEPFIHPESIDLAIQMMSSEEVDVGTLAYPITTLEKVQDTNVVKVVWGKGGALYFSRQPIPGLRDVPVAEWPARGLHHQHIGLYAFRRKKLLTLAQLPPSSLEQAEKLEQLRWLEAGYRIGVAVTPHPAIGVDTPEDLEVLRTKLNFDEIL